MSKAPSSFFGKKSLILAGTHGVSFQMIPPALGKGGFGVYLDHLGGIVVGDCSKIQISPSDMEDSTYVGGTFSVQQAGVTRIYLHITFAEGMMLSATLHSGPDWWPEYPETRKYRSKPEGLPENYSDPRVRDKFMKENPKEFENYPSMKTQTDLFAAVAECRTEPFVGSLTTALILRQGVNTPAQFYFLDRLIRSDLLLIIQCTGFQLIPAAADTPCVGEKGIGSGDEGEEDGMSDAEIEAALLEVGNSALKLSNFSGPRIDPGNPGFGGDIPPAAGGTGGTGGTGGGGTEPAPSAPAQPQGPASSPGNPQPLPPPPFDDRYPNGVPPSIPIGPTYGGGGPESSGGQIVSASAGYKAGVSVNADGSTTSWAATYQVTQSADGSTSGTVSYTTTTILK